MLKLKFQSYIVSKPLADYALGRDNNFNLIRLIAAFAVLVTHTFALLTGDTQTEPLVADYGVSLGTVAVDIFFITSGYLVTASLINRQNISEFIWARILRIYPALWVMLFLTLILTISITTLPLKDFLSSYQVYVYFAKCATLLAGVAYELPGVYEVNPYPMAVNGSLWTMPYELRMYLAIAALWVLSGVLPLKNKIKFFMGLTLLIAVSSFAYLLYGKYLSQSESLSRLPELVFMFFAGASYYSYRSKVVLSSFVFSILFILLVLSAIFIKADFVMLLWLFMPYVLFYLAYIPAGFLRSYNKLGDYSYGIYIYAFPVQQATVMLYPEANILGVLLVSGTITLILAILSWHFVEKPVLALKGHFMQFYGLARR